MAINRELFKYITVHTYNSNHAAAQNNEEVVYVLILRQKSCSEWVSTSWKKTVTQLWNTLILYTSSLIFLIMQRTNYVKKMDIDDLINSDCAGLGNI